VNPSRFLVVPALEKGRGGGHLARSAFLARSLRAAGREAFLFLPDPGREIPGGEIPGQDPEPWTLQSDPRLGGAEDRNWDFIVLDKFQTTAEEAASWSALAPLIGIDEGGPCRNNFEFLIDLLPVPKSRSSNPPNIAAPSLIPLPLTRRPSFQAVDKPALYPPPRILVSFGAEDAAGLGDCVAGALEKTAPALEVDFAKPGALIPKLRERLAEYDLLITHFGLTAFEALYARLPVVLVSPTRYHESLARNAGFFSLGVGRTAAGRIGRHISDPAFLPSLGERCRNIAARHGLENPPEQSLGELLAGFEPLASRDCPGCGAPFPLVGTGGETPGRFPERSYRRCGRCGLIYQIRASSGTIAYETDYFFDSYRKQYGKTYLEDFPNLTEAGRKRIALIRRLLKGGTGRLLDIGCAYGPFLSVAQEEGFEPLGIDPATDAVRHVREKLGLEALAGFFPDLFLRSPPEGESFAAVTLWYVIEHFADLRPALKEINRLLAVEGALAFSTPSFSGISGRRSMRAFLKNSPQDHFTVWSPALCGRLLARHGFRVKKIRVTGHHPERFPLGSRLRRGGFLWKLLLLASRLFKLGDTFECYAIKERSL
jgi:2-polyprenyl-3-methyl-5-hydroxy-6-metoxy-1,4-benzoquinol methylase/spore coat polysaccharide biosynthesis predicted glycosyltransferase SpsG